MSLHHTRSLAEKVAKWVCSGAPECIHCEAAKALQEVEAVRAASNALAAEWSARYVCEDVLENACRVIRAVDEETRG